MGSAVLSQFPTRDSFPECRDSTGQFVARNMGEVFDVQVVPLPRVPVTLADSGRFNLDNDTKWRRGYGNCYDLEGVR